MVPTQGTAIGTAINMAINSFSSEEDINKAIIVITDGENHEGNAMEMAEYAKSLGIEVDVIGVGSLKGAPIPIDAKKGIFLQDASGSPVTTFLNEGMAKEIAETGVGIVHKRFRVKGRRQARGATRQDKEIGSPACVVQSERRAVSGIRMDCRDTAGD